jgi:hypothetical protein
MFPMNLCQKLAWHSIQRMMPTSFIMHMLVCSGSISGGAILNMEHMSRYLSSTLFAAMKAKSTLVRQINQGKNVLQQGHLARLVFNSIFPWKVFGMCKKSYLLIITPL